MKLVVRAFPVLAGKETELHEFASTLKSDCKTQASEFYCKYGINRECWYKQELGGKLWVIAVTMLEAAEPVFSNASAATQEFDTWFKDKVLEISGIDIHEAPKGPTSQCIFDWQCT